MKLSATTTTVLFKWCEPPKKQVGSILLSDQLKMETRWATACVCGPDSIITPGDKILMSARPVTYKFNINGEDMENTADKSILAFKHLGELRATAGTILYEWLEPEEETTASGIILVQKAATKELEPRWGRVIASGPTSGVRPGDHILLAWKSDAYTIEIDGRELHNAGMEEISCFKSLS